MCVYIYCVSWAFSFAPFLLLFSCLFYSILVCLVLFHLYISLVFFPPKGINGVDSDGRRSRRILKEMGEG